MATLGSMLHTMMPGQEWESASTVPGRKGSAKASVDPDTGGKRHCTLRE